MSNKKLGLALVVVALIATGLVLRKPQVNVQVQVPPAPLGSEAGPVKTEGQEHLGGTTFGKVNATSSGSISYTLTANDLASNGYFFDTIIFTLSGVPGGGTSASATTTWTLPASSTMQHVLQNRGQRASVCFSVATSSGSGLILAEGTGFGLESASTTSPNAGGPGARTITGGTTACGWVVRGINNNNAAGHTGTEDLNLILTPTTEAQ